MPTLRRISNKGRLISLEVGENTRISDTAAIGAGVKIGKNVRIGRNAEIGSRSVIGDNSIIGANARLGLRVRLRGGTVIEQGATVGDYSLLICCTIGKRSSIADGARCIGMTLEGGARAGKDLQVGDYADWSAWRLSSKETVVIKAAIIGDNVSIFGRAQIGGYGSARRTVIGDYTEISNEVSSSALTIADYVDIGKRCNISYSSIDLSAKIGDDVTLYRAKIGWDVSIDDRAIVQATVEKGAHIGTEAIIRPGVTILQDWFIPDGAIVNPIPGSATPFVIPRVNPAINGE